MRSISALEVEKSTLQALELDEATSDLASIEAIACALRRAAGYLAPCSDKTLIRAVLEPLRGIHEEANVAATVTDTLENLVAHGDLLELSDTTQEETSGTLIFPAQLAFVKRSSGAVLLLGVAPDGLSSLPSDLRRIVEHVNHVRFIPEDAGAEVPSQLGDLGLIEIPIASWLQAPRVVTAAEHFERLDRMLQLANQSGSVPGLKLLNPERPVRYYAGRWEEASTQDGCFVGRRSQAYGADLWCYVEVEKGQPQRLFDFPLADSADRGCDDAWRLQAAIDRERGNPQKFLVRPGPFDSCVMDFFSPVPRWARRRWSAIGEPYPASKCLFSYKFSRPELAEELAFATDELWLEQIS